MSVQTITGMARFFRGISYIEDHLWEEFSLDDVAGAAAWSPYHYARLFRLVADDSVMAYARRRRLTEAAKRIVLGQDRLLDLALDCQFSSQEAFTRAFAKQMGVPPGNLRNSRQFPAMKLQTPITLKMLTHIQRKSITMKPEIVTLDKVELVGLAERFSFNESMKINALWVNFRQQCQQIGGITEFPAYGAAYNVDHENGDMNYIAAVPKAAYQKIPAGFEAITLNAGKYAKFTHTASGRDNFAEEVKETYTYIYGTWLPASNYDYQGAEFEYYDGRFEGEDLKGEVDILIHVKEKV